MKFKPSGILKVFGHTAQQEIADKQARLLAVIAEKDSIIQRQLTEITDLETSRDTHLRTSLQLSESLLGCGAMRKQLQADYDKLQAEYGKLRAEPKLTRQQVYAELADELGLKPPTGYFVRADTLAMAFTIQKQALEHRFEELQSLAARIGRKVSAFNEMKALAAAGGEVTMKQITAEEVHRCAICQVVMTEPNGDDDFAWICANCQAPQPVEEQPK